MGWFFGIFIALAFELSLAQDPVCVPTLTLNDGNQIPALALGTWRYTSPDDEPIEAITDAVYWAIEAGFRHIDTAYFYADEAQVGKGVARAIAAGLATREQIFVTTKLWSDQHKYEQVVPALKAQLKRLGLNYVDLYLIHMPFAITSDNKPLVIDYLETWRGMERVRSLGLAKSIGISNFNETQILRLAANCEITPAVGQIEVNPTYTDVNLVDVYKSLTMQVMAYAPFGFAVHRKDSEGFRPPPQFYSELIVKLAAKYGKSPAQILLRYHVDRGLIPIPKSTNRCHIRENVDLFDFQLEPCEVDSISANNIDRRVYQQIGDKLWQDIPNYPY